MCGSSGPANVPPPLPTSTQIFPFSLHMANLTSCCTKIQQTTLPKQSMWFVLSFSTVSIPIWNDNTTMLRICAALVDWIWFEGMNWQCTTVGQLAYRYTILTPSHPCRGIRRRAGVLLRQLCCSWEGTQIQHCENIVHTYPFFQSFQCNHIKTMPAIVSSNNIWQSSNTNLNRFLKSLGAVEGFKPLSYSLCMFYI